jgi:hypothetical protein
LSTFSSGMQLHVTMCTSLLLYLKLTVHFGLRQVVTKFFDWISENKKKGKIYDSPRPKASTKLTFCEYSKATWDSANSPPKFQLNNQGESRFALDHIRYAYPSNLQCKDEFIYLQTAVNSPAKATVSTPDHPIYNI